MIPALPKSEVEGLYCVGPIAYVEPVEEVGSFFVACIPFLGVGWSGTVPMGRGECSVETDKI